MISQTVLSLSERSQLLLTLIVHPARDASRFYPSQPHIIFVQCPVFAEIWGSHLQSLVLATGDLSASETPQVREALFLSLAVSSLMHANIWAQLRSLWLSHPSPRFSVHTTLCPIVLVQVAHL